MYRRLDSGPLSCMITFSVDARYESWRVLELLDYLLAQGRRRGLVDKKKRKESRLHQHYLNLTLVAKANVLACTNNKYNRRYLDFSFIVQERERIIG